MQITAANGYPFTTPKNCVILSLVQIFTLFCEMKEPGGLNHPPGSLAFLWECLLFFLRFT